VGRFSESEKSELWDRFEAGESLRAISRQLGEPHHRFGSMLWLRDGDVTGFLVGPLGPSDSLVIELGENMSFGINRTAPSMIVVVESPGGMTEGSLPLSRFVYEDGGVLIQNGSGDDANPPYIVTCWRGDGQTTADSRQ